MPGGLGEVAAWSGLDEAGARALWAAAARITWRYNPFPLTVSEQASSLLQRDPEQFGHILRVAQELHAHGGPVQGWARGVEAALDLARQRGLPGAHGPQGPRGVLVGGAGPSGSEAESSDWPGADRTNAELAERAARVLREGRSILSSIPGAPEAAGELGSAEYADPTADPVGSGLADRSAVDPVRYGDATGADVVATEELSAKAQAEVDSSRAEADSGEARAESRDVPRSELRSAAYRWLLQEAREALRSYREGRPAELGAGFTVTALDGGGHTVVYNGSADAFVRGVVWGDVPRLRIEFDSWQRWTSREYLLGDPPRTMAGLRAVADRTWGPGDEESGEGRITYRLTGDDSGAVARFAVHTVPPESAEYVHGPFVATDGAYGDRFHFGPEGTFTAQ